MFIFFLVSLCFTFFLQRAFKYYFHVTGWAGNLSNAFEVKTVRYMFSVSPSFSDLVLLYLSLCILFVGKGFILSVTVLVFLTAVELVKGTIWRLDAGCMEKISVMSSRGEK